MENRKCVLSFADLIDSLTVQQIKEVFHHEHILEFEKEISDLMHDISIDIKNHNLCFDANIVRLIIALSQINLFIWAEKEKMKTDKDNYYKHLKLSHQLNGIRNKIRNKFIEEINHQQGDIKTNINLDGLKCLNINL